MAANRQSTAPATSAWAKGSRPSCTAKASSSRRRAFKRAMKDVPGVTQLLGASTCLEVCATLRVAAKMSPQMSPTRCSPHVIFKK